MQDGQRTTNRPMTSQGLMPARNAGLSSHRPGKLNGHYRNFPGG